MISHLLCSGQYIRATIQAIFYLDRFRSVLGFYPFLHCHSIQAPVRHAVPIRICRLPGCPALPDSCGSAQLDHGLGVYAFVPWSAEDTTYLYHICSHDWQSPRSMSGRIASSTVIIEDGLGVRLHDTIVIAGQRSCEWTIEHDSTQELGKQRSRPCVEPNRQRYTTRYI